MDRILVFAFFTTVVLPLASCATGGLPSIIDDVLSSARCLTAAAVLVGATNNDPGIGFTTGFTYVFTAFQVP